MIFTLVCAGLILCLIYGIKDLIELYGGDNDEQD